MKAVSLTTNDADIEVVFGDFFKGREASEDAYHSLKYLYSDLTDIRKYYMRLGFHLQEFKNNEYYKDFGYLTLEEFCDVNLGLDKGAVSRCTNVYEQFNASHDVTCRAGVKTIGCAMDLSERWEAYSYTQLCEMLPLSEEDRKKVTPDMTVREIRELKKNLKKNGSNPVASTQPEEKEEKKLFDKKRYDDTRGIVRQNVVRNCDALNENVIFNVFDKDGKLLGGNVWCELIYKSGHEYYFRMNQAYDKDGKVMTGESASPSPG